MKKNHICFAKIRSAFACCLLAVGGLTGLPTAALSQNPERQPVDDPGKSFSYEVFTSLIFFDELKLDTSSRSIIAADDSANVAPTTEQPASKRARSFGLEYAKFKGKWMASPDSYLMWVMRPDALTRRSDLDNAPAVREMDTRAGSGFQQKPRISLLDNYEAAIRRGKSLMFGAGVYDDVSRRVTAFPEILEFGMNVVFPAKVSALRMGANLAGPESITEGLWRRGSQLQTDLLIYQGDEERSEIDGENSNTYDRGPSASDPYQGAAAQLHWTINPMWQAILFGGGGDTALQDGKRNDFLLMAAGVYQHEGLAIPLRIAGEFRLRREKFNTPSSPRVPLERRSVGLTAVGRTFAKSFTLVGLHQGAAQSHVSTNGSQTNVTTGDQLDLGQTLEVADGMRFTLIASQERREYTDDDGAKFGAFGTRSAATRIIRRFALQLTYNFNDGGR